MSTIQCNVCGNGFKLDQGCKVSSNMESNSKVIPKCINWWIPKNSIQSLDFTRIRKNERVPDCQMDSQFRTFEIISSMTQQVQNFQKLKLDISERERERYPMLHRMACWTKPRIPWHSEWYWSNGRGTYSLFMNLGMKRKPTPKLDRYNWNGSYNGKRQRNSWTLLQVELKFKVLHEPLLQLALLLISIVVMIDTL